MIEVRARRQLDDLEQKIHDVLIANGVDPNRVRADSVHIEFHESLGAVLTGQLFIPITAEDLR